MLTDPFRLGTVDGPGLELPSRLVFGPHETNLCEGRAIGARHVTYYERRARGGAGLIVTETASVHDLDWPYERSPRADDSGPGWQAVAKACHAHGVPVLASLGHAGMQGSSAFSQRETWGASSVPDAVTRELPKEMEAADIAEVLDGFARSAALASAAGLDGVEINAGQHSLVRQFLSGLTNLRGDEWGPDESGQRTAFLRSVIAVVRRGVGSGVVAVRLSCDELAPWAGVTPEMAEETASVIADDIDLLVVVRGSIFSVDSTRPDGHDAPGFNLDLAGRIRRAVDGRVPIVAQGSIVDPGQAEWALSSDDDLGPRADLVEMTRAQIADPDLGAKVAGRVAGAVRPCVLCNQRCRVRDNRNPIVSCTVNPSAGHESIDRESPDRHGAGPLIVVGAGPAGLETARVAAAAGMDVTVIEARDEAATVVRDFASAAGRGSFAEFADWLVAECDRVGVTVEYGRTVTDTDLDGWAGAGIPVVLATGGAPRPLGFDTSDDATVVRARDLLAAERSEPVLPEGPLLVWDPVGGPIAISVAETLALQGRTVHFACPDVTAGTLLSLTGDLAAASTRMLQAGITIHRHTGLRSVDAATATLVDRYTDEVTVLDVVGTVDGSTLIPNDTLWHETDRRHGLVGDTVAPRTVFEAILEGRRAAIALIEGRSVQPGLGSALTSGFADVGAHG